MTARSGPPDTFVPLPRIQPWAWLQGVLACALLAAVLVTAESGRSAILHFGVYLFLRAVLAIPTVACYSLARGQSRLLTWAVLVSDAAWSTTLVVELILNASRIKEQGADSLLITLGTSYAIILGAVFALSFLPGLGWILRLLGIAPAQVRSMTLLPALHERGYDWMTQKQSRELWQRCGDAAFDLPPWHEVGVLPGIAEGDVKALAAIAEQVAPRERKRA